MGAVLWLIYTVIDLFVWVLIAHVVLSWLVQFNIVNARNQFVYQVGNLLFRLTEPVLRPVRRILPNLGGIDISPVVVILLLYFLQRLIAENAHSMMG
jgi:YggT family protein